MAGKTTNEEKTVEKSAETRQRRWPSTKSDNEEDDALGWMGGRERGEEEGGRMRFLRRRNQEDNERIY